MSGDAAYPRVCILFALPEEASPYLQRSLLDEGIYSSGDPPGIFHGVLPRASQPLELFVAMSGTGTRNAAEQAVRLVEAAHNVARCLLICGFAGGLIPELIPGSLVIANKVMQLPAQHNLLNYSADSLLYAAAESLSLSGVPLRRGTIITIDRILIRNIEKRDLAIQTQADAVDMETAGAARIAQERGIPWLAVRAITDGANDDMPFDFNALADAEGDVSRLRVIGAALAHPWKIPALVRLGARSSLAAKNLATFLEAFLQQLPEIEI